MRIHCENVFTSRASVRLGAGQHLVDSVGVAAPLLAVLPQLTNVREGIDGAAEIGLPRLGIWLVLAWTVSS